MENHYNCIYMYTNKINGKRYIGQTVNFNKRHIGHKSSSMNEKIKDYHSPFHDAIRKYGIDNFQIDILAENIENQLERDELESSFIKYFNTLCCNGCGYNISSGGGVYGNPYAGKTEEEMKKHGLIQSEAKKGEKNPFYNKHGKDHPSSKKIVAVNIKTNEVFNFDSGIDACNKLGEKYNVKLSNTKVIQNCKYNHNPEEYLKTHNNHARKQHKGFNFYYLEDYNLKD